MPRAGVIAVVVLAAVLAGCGGDGKESATTPATARDPGREVVEAFVDAVAAGDAEAAWNLLSQPSRTRAGPTLGEFTRKAFPRLRQTLAPFAKGKLPVQVSENLDDTFGIVALTRGGNAYAAPLRREGSFWRVELPGPLRLDVSGPPPGSRGKFSNQIAVEAHGPGGAGLAVLYLDGVTLDARVYTGPMSATVFANFEGKLKPGTHTAVAFVGARGNAAAKAWTFEP